MTDLSDKGKWILTPRRLYLPVLAALWLSGALPPLGAHSHLVATTDGSAVVFATPVRLTGTRWHWLRRADGRPAVSEISRPVADISGDGDTVAATFFGERYCGVAGSTCFLSAHCSAGFSVKGSGIDLERTGRRTLLRLSRNGTRAWIEESAECPSLSAPLPPGLRGFYALPDLRLIGAAGSATIASARSGRRLITDRDQVLLLTRDGRLRLLDAATGRDLQHQAAALEAVIDAAGQQIVYLDVSGRLRWLDLARQTEGELAAAPNRGAAPALSDDGRLLAYLAPDGSAQLYDRQTATSRRLPGQERILEFVLTGNGRFLFAVTAGNRLIRVEAASGNTETWLETFPEIDGTSAPLGRDPSACPLVCYSPPEPVLELGRSAMVVLRGRFLDTQGWRVRWRDREWPLKPLSATAAWFQVPAELPVNGIQPLTVFRPGHPLEFTTRARVAERAVSCFGALHLGFDRLVSPENPARPGDIVHIFLSGLQGVERVADGVPNPIDRLILVEAPPEVHPALEPLFFGLAPGLIGIQQLDALILRDVASSTGPRPLFPTLPLSSVCELPVTAP